MQDPVGQAQRGEGDQPRADQPPAAAEERGAHRGQGRHREQVDRESVRLVKGPERGDPPGQEAGLRGLGHRLDHGGQRPGLPVAGALPVSQAGLGLQACHHGQEQPEPSQGQLAQPRRGPGVPGQRDHDPGDHVNEHRARCSGQPGQAGSEDPAERFPEHPDDHAPGHAGQSGQPGQGAARRGQQPAADAELDPHRRTGRRHRVVDPGGLAQAHQVLHPRRRDARGRLDHLGGQPGGHGRLGLQDAVEQPQQAEPDPQQPPSRGLGSGENDDPPARRYRRRRR